MLKIKVAEARDYTLVLAEVGECGCADVDRLADKALPDYTKSPKYAVHKTAWHFEHRSLFWGVHLHGRHVLDLKDVTGLSVRWGGQLP